MALFKNVKVRNAVYLGTLCSVSYLGVYLARNVLSAVTPQIIEGGKYNEEYIGSLSSLYFIFYAVGQLINGIIGDKIKAKHMLSFGLFLAGICNVIFPFVIHNSFAANIAYGMSGFFLSMIYAPMSKVVSENTEPIHAVRCSLGYTFASLFGSPLAGIIASVLVWQSVFYVSSAALIVMGVICFVVFAVFEKRGIVKYGQYKVQKNNGGSIKVLFENKIVVFTIVSILTGVVRTSVVFWLPTYISDYLDFSPKKSALIFTVATLVISTAAFIAIFVYERLKRNMILSVFIFFVLSAASFLILYFIKMPFVNVSVIVIGIITANCASTILWSVYCPSLRDTGMVSSATGFLDFVSYMAAAASTSLFAKAVTTIGWKNLILIWFALMAMGIIATLPIFHKAKIKMENYEL